MERFSARREVLFGIATVGTGTLIASKAGGQTSDFRIEVAQIVSQAVYLADTSLDIASKLDEDNQFDFELWVSLYRDTLNAVSQIPLESILDISRLEELDIVLDNIELGGEALDLTSEPVLSSEIQTDADTFLDVILDILLDTLGIPDPARSAFAELLALDANAEIIETLRNSIEGDDWSGIPALTRRLVRNLTSRAARNFLRERLSNEVYLQLIKALGGKAFPVVGQALMAGNFLYSLYENWDRIRNLL